MVTFHDPQIIYQNLIIMVLCTYVLSQFFYLRVHVDKSFDNIITIPMQDKMLLWLRR